MRDVRKRDHLAKGLLVKIVRPEDEATGVTRDGEIAELVGKDAYDPQGIVVRLTSGEVGRVLRVWEGGRARELPVPDDGSARPKVLPTYDPPRERTRGREFRLADDEVERLARKELGELANATEIDRMIQHHEEGLGAPLLRRFGIRSEELEKKTADLLLGVDDDALSRKLGAAPLNDERPDDEDEDDGKRSERPRRRPPNPRGRR